MVPTMREPVIPNGWPIEIDPPLTFSFAGSRPSLSRQYTTCEAKASFSSHTSMSSTRSPWRFKSLGTAYTGPMPISSGSQPATANPRKISFGLMPSCFARSIDMSSVADAPSESCEELPAVTVPCPLDLSKTGGSESRPSSVVSARLHSSFST